MSRGISLFIDWDIIILNSSGVVITILFDWISLIFIGSVLLISSIVILYRSSYIGSDIFRIRFLFLVLLFIFSIMFLIMSPNIISILLGWDGLGLVSYCLVIYFQRYKSYNSGILTILSNRIGDVAILISIAWIFNNGGWNYIYYVNYYNSWYDMMIYMIVIASFTKSAQIPFSSWLPAAIAAPTPVSALVHSSTLVTAGVYLLIRFRDVLLIFNINYFLLLSSLTMFIAGLGANFEYDLRKIIALSTLSQLGLIIRILFIGFPILAYFHLLTHAFFRALLFLCAGLIIHVIGDSQDIRYMGYIIYQMPFTSICFAISSFSLCGIPFLAGFYSKDIILESLSFEGVNSFVFLLFYISVGLTASYRIRLVYYCLGKYSGLFTCQCYIEDFYINVSIILLAIISVLGGRILSWFIFSYPTPLYLPIEVKLLSVILILLGFILGYIISLMSFSYFLKSINYTFFKYYARYIWFMPFFRTYMIYPPSLITSKYFSVFIDMGWGEYLVSKSFFSYLINLNKFNIYYQNNNVKLYLIRFLFYGLFCLLIL